MVMTIFAVGGMIFGRFEQHKPRWRRVLKQALVLAIFVLADGVGGWASALGLLGVFAVAAVVIHGWWLPKHGINGWSAEPYDQYLALVRGGKSGGYETRFGLVHVDYATQQRTPTLSYRWYQQVIRSSVVV
jgi:Glycosyl hydrolase family 1